MSWALRACALIGGRLPSDGRPSSRPILRAADIARCLLTLALLYSLTSAADQTDPSLDGLFAELRTAADASEAARVEALIWERWLAVEDETASRLMAEGVQAMAEHRLDRALSHFSALVDRSPDFAEAWNKRATVHFLRGDHDASVRDIQRTLSLEPRHFGAISGLGLIMMAREDAPAALEAFEDLLELHPHAAGARARSELLRRWLRERSI